MKKLKEVITDKVFYVLASLLILGLTGLLNMRSRLEAVEIEAKYNQVTQEKMRIDILAIRCAVTKEKLVCLEFEAAK